MVSQVPFLFVNIDKFELLCMGIVFATCTFALTKWYQASGLRRRASIDQTVTDMFCGTVSTYQAEVSTLQGL